MQKKGKKIIVAISGGVDSAVTAFMLKKQGFKIIGLFMRLNVLGDEAEKYARMICKKLNIKFYPVNLSLKFKKEIINYFLESYKTGQTPNPCVKCNKIIKFGELFKIANDIGADYLATGHYAKNVKFKTKDKFVYKLFGGKDKNKDQSYFLYNLTQSNLEHILFPLGDYIKEQIKKIADKENLPYFSKESQDICFLSGDHNNFLIKNIKLKSGDIKTLDEKKVGKHRGLPLYTIGQRRGIEIGGIGPFYAVRCDYKKNILYVTKDKDDDFLYKKKLYAENVNWISGAEPEMPLVCLASIRYRHNPQKCKITKVKNKKEGDCYVVEFDKAQRAITAGQSIVFYGKDNEVFGGGVIDCL